MSLFVAQESAPGAGGAAFGQILIVAAFNIVIFGPLVWFIWRERAGKVTTLGKIADWMADKEQMPRWFTLPTYLGILAILSAAFGVAWDIPLHMQEGRDEGPLANPAHYFIYFGLVGIFCAGVISATLAKDKLPKRSFKIMHGWRAPMGSLVVIGSGTIALIGFPLDDIWHRLYGQDVTEWGPTHTMMIGGAVTFVIGLALMHAEARQTGAPGALGIKGRVRGAFLLSTCIIPFYFLAEFELGLPQFPAATQFIIAGLLCGWIFTACRRYFGPGGALLAWGFYLVGHLFVTVGMILMPNDVLVAHMLLFLPSALIVEIVALVVTPAKGLRFEMISAVLIGTVGMYAEWLWTHQVMPLPQPLPGHAVPLMLAVGTGGAIAGGLIGHWQTQQLQRTEARGGIDSQISFQGVGQFLDRWHLGFAMSPARKVYEFWDKRQTPVPPLTDNHGSARRHGYVLVGGVLFFALMAAFAPPVGKQGVFADIELSRECDGSAPCSAFVTVTMDPEETDRAVWFYGYYWQGAHDPEEFRKYDPADGSVGVMRMEMVPTGTPGQFRSAYEMPMWGEGKSQIRLHQAPNIMLNLPLYAPDDPAITADKGRLVTVVSGERKEFIYEPSFLQRERKDDVPAWLWGVGFAVVIAAWVALFLFYWWLHAQAAWGTNPTVRRGNPTKRKPISA